jgi:hypothetical protein
MIKNNSFNHNNNISSPEYKILNNNEYFTPVFKTHELKKSQSTCHKNVNINKEQKS